MSYVNYKERALDAWRTPDEPAAGPDLRFLLLGMSVALALYLAFAAAAAPSDFREKYFVEEPGLVNALSAILLAAAAAFAAVVASVQGAGRSRWFWLFFTAGFAFFGLDELVQGHEKVGDKLDEILGSVGGLRNMNDAIVVIYGLIGLAVLAYFLPEFLRNRTFAVLATIGFVFYAMQTGIDALATERTTVSAIVEESAKLFASGFFALGAYRMSMSVVKMPADAQVPAPRS